MWDSFMLQCVQSFGENTFKEIPVDNKVTNSMEQSFDGLE